MLAFPGSGPQAGLNLALEGKVSAEPTDELHFPAAELRLYFFKLAFPDGEGGTASRWIGLITTSAGRLYGFNLQAHSPR